MPLKKQTKKQTMPQLSSNLNNPSQLGELLLIHFQYLLCPGQVMLDHRNTACEVGIRPAHPGHPVRKHSHTSLHLCSIHLPPSGMFLEGGMKPENLEETRMSTGRTCDVPHSNQEPWESLPDHIYHA